MKKACVLWGSLAFLVGCVSTPKTEYPVAADREDPAMQKFVAYYVAVKQSASFEDVLPIFFYSDSIRSYQSAMGWGRFVYDASFKGIKNGNCKSLQITKAENRRRQIYCQGEFLHKTVAGDHWERMKLQVYVVQKGEAWYIDKAGLKHTQGTNLNMPADKRNDRWMGIGLKF